MLSLLLLFLVCLPLAESVVVAPAVSTTTNALCPIPIAAQICVCNTPTCADPLSSSCVLTIFACVWVAVHRNIPGPAQKSLSIYYEWLKVVVLTLLVPEWILAWAMRQRHQARKLVTRLEEARVSAKEEWEKKHEIRAAETDGERASNEGKAGESAIGFGMGEHEDEIPLTRPHHTRTDIGDAGASGGDAPDTLTTAARLATINEPWTVTHAFFIIMGGFHLYDGKPLYPLSSKDVLALVKRGALVPPTTKELEDRSKGDALSKGVAVIQTLWFVMQCIARRIKHLPMTSLEVMTLAYTVITLAMYAAWWHKPLNISCAMRVPGTAAKTVDTNPRSIWMRVYCNVMGQQDELVTLSQERRVPTFWADGAASGDVAVADIVALLVAMVFGAVHCVAWSYAFPSPMEQLMWRVSAISIVIVPVTLLLSFMVYIEIPDRFTARVVLLVLSFTTLWSLPIGAYQTVQWTTFIPHI